MGSRELHGVESVLFLRLPENQRGRDFVVGDIHGYFDLFDRLLEQVNFDPRVDRMISVGDCIDRGPFSERVTEYLGLPWFFCLRGNHEDLLLDAADHEPGAYEMWIRNGGIWSEHVHESLLSELAEHYRKLPWALEVLTRHGNIGVVHANPPAEMSWPEFVGKLERDRLSRNELKSLAWSRERFKLLQRHLANPGAVHAQSVAGVHRVYVGHSIVREPSLCGNVVFIDTGVYMGGRLSMVDLGSEQIYSVEAPPAADVSW